MSDYTDHLDVYFIAFGVSFWELIMITCVSIKNNSTLFVYKMTCIILLTFHIFVQLFAFDSSYYINISSIIVSLSSLYFNFKKLDKHSYRSSIAVNIIYTFFSIIISNLNIYIKTEYSNDFVNNIMSLFVASCSFLPSVCLSYILYVYLLHKFKYAFLTQEIKPENIKDDDCCICLEKLNSKPCVALRCSHPFHKECISTHFNYSKTCPICRRDYEMVSILV